VVVMLDFKGNWIWYLPLVEFAYNNSFQSTISMKLYEFLYGRKSRYIAVVLLDFKGNWIWYLPLVEFAYNNSFQSTISMEPYEFLYGCKSRSPLYWDEVCERQLLGPEMVQDTQEKVTLIRERTLKVYKRAMRTNISC
jgi:hypothetical protein